LIRLYSLVWLSLGSALPGPAAPAARPRVALVLEGGGALGFAHIGVLKYLEEHHIPVDFVAGTSMGGLVGGLYSIGKSPAEIQQLTQQIDWDEVLSGRTAFQDLSFRRKEDRIAFPNPLEMGFRSKKFNFPAGLNSGHQTGLVIDRATLAYSDNLKFDDLPIPFRCVATDMTLGREKVFDHGSISQALRATMAIPAVFSPVIVDGHVYTDGGAVDNLPVDVAKRAGADVVIAVYLDPGPVSPASYDSMFSVAARNISIMVSANELKNMEAADILLSVDLSGFTSASFKEGGKIVPKGYEAAVKKEKMLGHISISDEEWAAYFAQRSKKIQREIPVPQFVQVVGNNRDYNAALKESLERYVGKPIEPPEVEESLTRFVGTGVMSSIGYTLVNKMGRTGLEVKTYEKTYGPPFLNVGVTIDGSDPDNVLFGMAARLTFMNLGGYRAEWRNDAFFGSTYGVTSEYYRPFSRTSKWFVAPRIYALSSAFNEYSGKDKTSLYRLERNGFGGDVGYSINSRSEVRIGEDLFWSRAVAKINGLAGLGTQRNVLSALKYRYYGVDNVQVPRSGLNLEFNFGHYGLPADADSFQRAELRASYFHRVSEPGSILFSASGGTAFHTSIDRLGFQFFALGGPLRLGAYGQNQLVGNQYFLLQAGYEHKLLSFTPLLGEGLYAIGLAEVGKTYGYPNPGVPAVPADGSVGLIARSLVGPVFVGVSVGNGGYRKWWFGVGRVF
jgi:NTE family protein